MFTIRYDDPYYYNQNHPWIWKSIWYVTAMDIDLLYQEVPKAWGGTEVYSYGPLYSDSTGSVLYDPGPLNWPSDVDAAVFKVSLEDLIMKGYGFTTTNVYTLGALIYPTEVREAINGKPKPIYIP